MRALRGRAVVRNGCLEGDEMALPKLVSGRDRQTQGNTAREDRPTPPWDSNLGKAGRAGLGRVQLLLDTERTKL